jgi:hypothetical protein
MTNAVQKVPAIANIAAFRIPPAARHSERRKPTVQSVRISKPRRDAWVQIHTDAAFQWEGFWAYEKDRQHYMVPHDLYNELEESVQSVFAEHDFYLAAGLNEEAFIWPVKHSDTDWYRSMREAVSAAMQGWVQVQSNARSQRYDCRTPQCSYEAPVWDGLSTGEQAAELFNKTFSGRLITTPDHEILERIRGRK